MTVKNVKAFQELTEKSVSELVEIALDSDISETDWLSEGAEPTAEELQECISEFIDIFEM